MKVNTYLNQDHFLIKLTGSIDPKYIPALSNQLDQCLETVVPAVLIDCDRFTYPFYSY